MSNRDNHPSRLRPIAVRALATLLAMTLAFAGLAPSFAWAEAESEGEGSAQPGAGLPGLEEGTNFEPGGEETSLEEVPALEGEEEVELPIGSEPEPEPAPAPEAAAPPAVEPGPPAVEPTPPVAEAPAPAPSPGPVYGTSEEAGGPSYETTTPSTPAEPVHNEAIVAPPSPAKASAPARPVHRTTAPQEAPAPAPAETPEPVAPSSTPPAVPADRGGGLVGRPSHTVAAGECLWSIAEGVLPAGATDAEIAAEVSRLWHLNAARIGTGDPSLILVGTVLRLH